MALPVHLYRPAKNNSYSLTESKETEEYMKIPVSPAIITQPGPKVIKLFSCSTQLSIKFSLLINVKMPTIVGILTFMSRKNSILGFSEPKKTTNFLIFLYL